MECIRLKAAYVIIMFFCLTMIIPDCAHATVGFDYLYESHSKTFINYNSNLDYHPRFVPFRFIQSIDALNYVRQKLVGERKLQDIPVLIRVLEKFMVYTLNDSIQLSMPESERLYKGEEGTASKPIGRCYMIVVHDYDINYQDLLPLLVKLKDIREMNSVVEVSSPEALKTSLAQELKMFRNIRQEFDPSWAPDGRYLLTTVWDDGRVHPQLLDIRTKEKRDLEPLDADMVTRPIWSPDSRFIAYASLNEIKVHYVGANTTETIDLTDLIKGARNETLLSFDASQDMLFFAGDTNLFFDYSIYAYDLANKDVSIVEEHAQKPAWREDAYDQIAKYYAFEGVKSPSGDDIAEIKEDKGLRTVTVKALKSKDRLIF